MMGHARICVRYACMLKEIEQSKHTEQIKKTLYLQKQGVLFLAEYPHVRSLKVVWSTFINTHRHEILKKKKKKNGLEAYDITGLYFF